MAQSGSNSADSTVVVAILSFAIAVAGVALFWLHLNKKERDLLNRGVFTLNSREVTEAEQKLLQNKKKREKKKRAKANQKARRAEELAESTNDAAGSPKSETTAPVPTPKPDPPVLKETKASPEASKEVSKESKPTPEAKVAEEKVTSKKSKKSKTEDEAKARAKAEEEAKKRREAEEKEEEEEKAKQEEQLRLEKELELQRAQKEREAEEAAAEEQRKREAAELEAKRLAEREEQEKIKRERIELEKQRAAKALEKQQSEDRKAFATTETAARETIVKEQNTTMKTRVSTFDKETTKLLIKQVTDKEDSLRQEMKDIQQEDFAAIVSQSAKEYEACQPAPPPSPPSPPSGPVQRIPTPPPNPPPETDLSSSETAAVTKHQNGSVEISAVLQPGTKLDVDLAWIDNSITITNGPRDEFGLKLGLQRGMTLGSIDGDKPREKDLVRIRRKCDKGMTLVFCAPTGMPAPPAYPPPPVVPTPPAEPPPVKHQAAHTTEQQVPLIPMCENDGVCAHINDSAHQKLYRHTCLIEGCEHSSEPWHTRYFDHPPNRSDNRKRHDNEWKGQIEVVDTAKDEQLMLNGNWAKIKIRKLKESIAEKWKIAPSQQKLTTKSGIKMDNPNSVCKDYDIREGSIIYVEYPQQKSQHQHQHQQRGQHAYRRVDPPHQRQQHQQQQLPFVPQTTPPNNLPTSMFYPAGAAAQNIIPTTAVQLPQSQFMPQFNVAAATTYAQAPVSPNYMMQMKQMQQVTPPDNMAPNQWASQLVTDAYHYS